MQVVTGSSNGFLKWHNMSRQQTVRVWSSPDARCEIDRLCWGDATESEVLMACRDGYVRSIACSTDGELALRSKFEFGRANTAVAVAAVAASSTAAVVASCNAEIASAIAQGPVPTSRRRRTADGVERAVSQLGLRAAAASAAVAKATDQTAGVRAVGLSLLHDRLVVTNEYGQVQVQERVAGGGGWQPEPLLQFAVAAGPNSVARNVYANPIDCARTAPANGEAGAGGWLAAGGRAQQLAVWDLSRPDAGAVWGAPTKATWRGKNVRPDMLRLDVPYWLTDLRFFSDDPSKIVTCTGYGQVRIYDTRQQMRPVKDFKVGENRLTSLVMLPDNRSVIVSDVRGTVHRIDLTSGLLLNSLSGFAGSVRSLDIHPSENVVASCGLDRYVRVHKTTSRLPLFKVYAKQQMNCLMFSSAVEEPEEVGADAKDGKSHDEGSGDDEDAPAKAASEDQFWSSLKEVEDQWNEQPEDDADGDSSDDEKAPAKPAKTASGKRARPKAERDPKTVLLTGKQPNLRKKPRK